MKTRAALLSLLLVSAPAFAKSLHWSEIDVDARLDKDGNLRVVERQQIVFDGDWNGGERDFNLGLRQKIEVDRIVRIEDGKEIALEQGDLAFVDRWDFAASDVVRWRSRLPSDPPFDNEERTYVLHYTYSNILVQQDERGFRLNHDFGLPQRAGVVERLTLRLEFDSAWGNIQPVIIERTSLPPGEGVIVSRDLTWRGTGRPAGVERTLPGWAPLAVLAFFVAGAAALVAVFAIRERATGRFAPVVAQFDPAILDLDAEVAGAAWDAGVGAPEVAAVLARMSQEGKLSTRAEGKTLHMSLKVNRYDLPGHEGDLVKALFDTGSEETSTDLVKERYRSTGFDPARVIRAGVEAKLAKIPGWTEKVRRFRVRTDVLWIIGAAILLVLASLPSQFDGVAAAVGASASGILSIFAMIAAKYFSRRMTAFAGPFTLIAVLMLIACAPFFVIAMVATIFGLQAPVLAALASWVLALLKLVLDLLQATDPPAKIAFRKRIAGARRFFIEQLALPQPSLRDEWFPYLLAFGLGTNVDRWFRAFGGEALSSGMTSWSSSSSSSSPSSSGSSWTGGGGAFGGAGATGTWAIAAGAMAAGVSAPSSSGSGGGGGGGGGSSSGGGGGGGW